MGFFDRFSGKKQAPAQPPPEFPREPAELQSPAEQTASEARPHAVALQPHAIAGQLRSARDRLDGKDLPGALAIYEEVLVIAGDRADILTTISGDLGSTGHAAEIIELVAPRYDAVRHGPAAGLNVLQAYLAVRETDAAQHMLDILFSLNRPDLEERLHGFSNAISELFLQGDSAAAPAGSQQADAPPQHAAKVSIITISKPVWFYGLEPLGDRILPSKGENIRRIAFTQLGLPEAYPDIGVAMRAPEDEVGRLSRALPVWLAEVFYYSPRYAPLAAVAVFDQADGSRLPMIFSTEWSAEHIRQLVDTTSEAVDYAVTGTLRHQAGDYELALRVWEVKKFRARKQFVARWTPATADAELGRLRDEICQYMECGPEAGAREPAGAAPSSPRAWLDALGASLNLFLTGKDIFPKSVLPAQESLAADAAKLAAESPVASLAWLTFARRCRMVGVPAGSGPARLHESPLVREAAQLP
jgi:hypothetical protein